MSIIISKVLASPNTWLFFVFGLICGSFFNVCIYRIPLGVFWKSHRSFCPQCKTPIPFWLNIPVLSYLLLGGKTKCCSKELPIFYPLVELFTGLVFVYIYWRFPFFEQEIFPSPDIDTNQFLRFSHALVFCSLLIVCSVIDFQHMIIPDGISLSMIAMSPLIALVHPELTLRSSLLGVFLGGAGVYAVAWTYYLLRKREGIGMGDAKLLAAIGGWLGYESLLPTVLFGSIIGSFVGLGLMVKQRHTNMQTEIPFGPFLAFGAAFYLLSPIHWLEILSKIHQVLRLEP